MVSFNRTILLIELIIFIICNAFVSDSDCINKPRFLSKIKTKIPIIGRKDYQKDCRQGFQFSVFIYKRSVKYNHQQLKHALNKYGMLNAVSRDYYDNLVSATPLNPKIFCKYYNPENKMNSMKYSYNSFVPSNVPGNGTTYVPGNVPMFVQANVQPYVPANVLTYSPVVYNPKTSHNHK